MLSQEIIYQNLSRGKFSEVISLLYSHENKLDEDPSIATLLAYNEAANCQDGLIMKI